MSACPLCDQEIKKPKVVYGHRICKKCWAGYINRRQIAYIIDAFILLAVAFFTGLLLALLLGDSVAWPLFFAIVLIEGTWLSRDALSGRSPGKVCMNMEAIDNGSGRAIGLKQAFVRNWPLAIPVGLMLLAQLIQTVQTSGEDAEGPEVKALTGLAKVAALIIVITMAVQINKGPRWGDGLAKTRVIWRRYAESPVFNPAVAKSVAAAPEFAPAMRSGAADASNDPYRAPRT